MAVVVSKSAALSGRDASPRVLANADVSRVDLKRALGVVTAVTGDSAGSTYLFCSVPSNALVSSIKVSSPDIGTTTAFDLGLYKNTDNGGAVVDADFFKAALSVSGGALSKSEQVFGNVITPANFEQRLWQLLGLAADPQFVYDVVGTLTGAADAGGAILIEVEYAE